MKIATARKATRRVLWNKDNTRSRKLCIKRHVIISDDKNFFGHDFQTQL